MNKNKAIKQYEYRYDEIKSIRSKVRERSYEKTTNKLGQHLFNMVKGNAEVNRLMPSLFGIFLYRKMIAGTQKNSWTKNEYKRKMRR
jgi:hypothetical protein